ncbi:MAG: hypothetical protein ACTHMS_11780 [Jatrophihabitans sp.]|uniref:hypothetical protein n=1 Tax=Jatrophihabitans sp. TaxID=1932789 RepID=UPI003F8153A9
MFGPVRGTSAGTVGTAREGGALLDDATELDGATDDDGADEALDEAETSNDEPPPPGVPDDVHPPTSRQTTAATARVPTRIAAG